jgi:hypothetical protein
LAGAASAAAEESQMAKMTGKLKTAKKPTKQTTVKQTSNKRKLASDATVNWAGRENPFREGCGAWKRTEIVRKASGQTVSAMRSNKGLRATTLATLARLKLIAVI